MDTIPPKALTKLHHILKELHRVAKKCKVFETQKAIKKVRTFTEKVAQAEQSSDIPESVKESRVKELKKAERDLSLIKDLDINTTCIPSFKAAIPTSRIRPSFHQELLTACDSAAQKFSEASAAAPESIASANSAEPQQQQQQLTDLDRISKRLHDAKEFKKAVADGLAELVKLVGGGGGGDGGVVSSGEVEVGSKKRARGQGESNGDAGVGKKQKSGAAAGPGRYVLRPSDDAKKDGAVYDEDADEAGDEMDDDEAFDSDPEHYVPPSQNRPSKASPVSAPASKKAKKEPASSKKGQRVESSFVTSLNDGLSDVSLSDLEVDEKGRLKGGKKDDKKKKNRMGQRARQELYEKQFGKQANHVIKRQVEVIKHKAKAAPAVVDEKVHPSWAAKRAQKQTITAFAGNKIVFGGEGNSSAQSASAVASGAGAAPAETLHPSWAAKRMQSAKILDAPAGKKIVFGDAGGSGSKSEASKEDGEKLHPSWAAKKKQSAAIGSAAGKKTLFGDEGGSKSSPKAAPVVEENLHPSWAAKKKQSAAIGGATGKKITFGDD
ncbi:hypothetical protein CcCBS67573_g05448 [Chytriomyces confervae]|uniref:Bud22 domain-containing protein n=1 Tax=Chytriomyces confervae TaxID=246404 RepID=A0A507FAB9_9FUNG|nr:hypothetical protein CcCBS67573_g05448 [Chytriomyces confervae]